MMPDFQVILKILGSQPSKPVSIHLNPEQLNSEVWVKWCMLISQYDDPESRSHSSSDSIISLSGCKSRGQQTAIQQETRSGCIIPFEGNVTN